MMRCPHCGADSKIQVQVWADPNTGLVVDWDGGTYDWCGACSADIVDNHRCELWNQGAESLPGPWGVVWHAVLEALGAWRGS